MTLPPWLVLLLVASLAAGLAYGLLTRRYGWRIAGYWAVICAGAIGGELAAEGLGWELVRVGDLRLLADATGALLVIGALWFLGV